MDDYCGGIYMQGQMETNLGKIVIESDVIATYAGSVAVAQTPTCDLPAAEETEF